MNADLGRRDGGALSLRDWVRIQAPHLDVVSASVPEPLLRRHNLVAVGADPALVRDTVRDWERIEAADGAVGTLVLGRAPDRPDELDRPAGADPEGVAAHAAVRALQGGIPGAIIGAVVVATIVVVLDGWSGVVIGAALGGVLFGFPIGAVFAYTRGSGWGQAYRHVFVDPAATDVVIASIHADDPAPIDAALAAAESEGGVRLFRVAEDGRIDPVRR